MIKKIVCVGVVIIMALGLFACGRGKGDTQEEAKDIFGYTKISATATAIENMEGIEAMEEIEGMIELDTWFFTSGVPNNAIKVKYPNHLNENAVFECLVDEGDFWFQNQYVKNATLNPEDTIYWHPEDSVDGTEQAFIDIVLKVDNNIIGYAVIEVLQTDSSVEYSARLLKSAVFPKVDEKYQNITETQVKSIIAKVKKGENGL